MANFDVAYDRLLINEGHYANHPDDRGGETYCGVTEKNWPNWKGWEIINVLKSEHDFPNNLKSNQELSSLLKEFYRTEYWNLVNGDMILNQDVANELFDTGVLMGCRKAVSFLQKSLNLLNNNQNLFRDIAVDGKMGSKTLWNTNNYSYPKSLVKSLNSYQGKYLIEITENDPTQEVFFRGWLERT